MKVDSKTYGWITVKIQESLAHEIDKEVSGSVTFGYPKYRSRSDFIKVACLMLLEKERSLSRQNKPSAKKLGEEILVTRS